MLDFVVLSVSWSGHAVVAWHHTRKDKRLVATLKMVHPKQKVWCGVWRLQMTSCVQGTVWCNVTVDVNVQAFTTAIVDRYTCRTPHLYMLNHCTVQTTCVPWFKGPEGQEELCSNNFHTSTRHVSPCASHCTEHEHKFSLTYPSCVTVVIFSETRPVVHASTYPL